MAWGRKNDPDKDPNSKPTFHTHNYTVYRSAVICMDCDKKCAAIYECDQMGCGAQTEKPEGPCKGRH